MWKIREGYIQSFGIGTLRETQHLESLCIKLRIILKWISEQLCARLWTELTWLRVSDIWCVVDKKSLMNSGLDNMSGMF
jgi:hypothetical protein